MQDMNKKHKTVQTKGFNELINSKAYFILVCISLGFLLCGEIITNVDGDILWHYKLGEEIALNHTVSTIDSFSWQPGIAWIQHEWLYDLILYFIVKHLDFLGFIILYIVNQATTIYVAGVKNKATSDRLFYLIATISLMIVPKNCCNRPAEFSVWIIVLLIELYKNQKSKYNILWYSLIGIFTANFHGGLLMILITTQLIMIITELVIDKTDRLKNAITKLSWLAAMVLASTINPTGYHLLFNIFKVQSLKSTPYIQEWQPVEMNLGLGILITLIVISLGYTLKKENFSKQDCINIALISGYLILGLTSQKALIIFLYIWLLNGYKYTREFITDFLRKIDTIQKTAKKAAESIKEKLKNIKVIEPALVAMMLSIGIIMATSESSLNDYINKGISLKVINYLKDNNDTETKICNSYTWGNYLIYNNIKCFVDSRQFPYTRELSGNTSLDELINVGNTRNKEDIKKFIDKYEFDYVITSNELNISWYMEQDARFEKVVTDDIINQVKEKDKIILWKRKES